MDIDVIVPVRRRARIVDRLLRSFSRNTVRPAAVLLVTNELDPADLDARGLDVRLVRFDSDTYPIGFNDAALRRNVGIWASSSSHVLMFDDDQIAPPALLQSTLRVLAESPVCWGHHRYIDFEAYSFEDLLALRPEAGRARETPPNAWHSWRSAYAGLCGAERALLQRAGGFDMIFSGRHSGEDQDLGRRLAALVHDGDAIYIHEPPFAWHPQQATPWEEPRYSNVCRNDHQLEVREIDGVSTHACSRCPFYWVQNVAFTERSVRMPFDPSKMRITVTPVANDARAIAAVFPFMQEAALNRIAVALRDPHEEFVSRVSSPDMAISLEAAAFLRALCEGLRPRRVLDLGSGFSFRSFFERASRPTTALSGRWTTTASGWSGPDSSSRRAGCSIPTSCSGTTSRRKRPVPSISCSTTWAVWPRARSGFPMSSASSPLWDRSCSTTCTRRSTRWRSSGR